MKDAPHFEPEGELSQEDEIELFRHYGISYTDAGSVTAEEDATSEPERPPAAGEGSVGRDASGPASDDAMARPEEELRADTAAREKGRARLRKYVATEHLDGGEL